VRAVESIQCSERLNLGNDLKLMLPTGTGSTH